MELDELKYQLNSKLSVHSNKSDNDIRLLLRLKAKSFADKLKRSLYFEWISSIIFTLIFSGFSIFTANNKLKIYFGVFAVVMAIFIFILKYLIKKTSQLNEGKFPVKTNLVKLVSIIEEYKKRAFQFTMLLLPVCFLFSFWLGYNDSQPTIISSDKALITSLKSRPNTMILSAGYFGLLAIVVYYFAKWYLKKLFGNYLDQLRSCLSELKDD